MESRQHIPVRRIALVLLLSLLLAACSRPADEAALREAIAAMAAALEQRRADPIMERIDEKFAGPGELDRDGLRRMLALHFLRNQSIGATLTPPTIVIDGERAEARFSAVVTGGSGWIPERASGYQLLTVWRRDGSSWLLEYAEWK